MKRIIMRAYWGEYDDGHRITKRKARVDRNIEQVLNCEFKEDFVTYVFGQENFDYLVSKGFRCVLLWKEPTMFDAVKYQYRHKLEALKFAMEEEKADEMVHLDWDCLLKKPFPNDFWDRLGKKESFQANLMQYRRRKATWRGKEDSRKIPNGGFCYIRDKNVPTDIIKIWETMKSPSCEPAMAKYVDHRTDGWKGKEHYWNLFEPEVVRLHRCCPFSAELIEAKNACYTHYQGGR